MNSHSFVVEQLSAALRQKQDATSLPSRGACLPYSNFARVRALHIHAVLSYTTDSAWFARYRSQYDARQRSAQSVSVNLAESPVDTCRGASCDPHLRAMNVQALLPLQ